MVKVETYYRIGQKIDDHPKTSQHWESLRIFGTINDWLGERGG